MDAAVTTQLKVAVRAWAAETYGTDAIAVGDVAYNAEEERYLVDFAVKELGHWRVAEVWLEDGEITLINDLGEGLPLASATWPWIAEEE